MKKKFLAIILAVSLFTIIMSNFLVSGQSVPTLRVSKVSGAPGDTVKVTVSLENNPGIITAKILIGYDSSSLALINAEDSKLLNDGFFCNDYNRNPFILTWSDDLAHSNNTKNGVIVTLTFKILDTCKAGNYNIDLTYSENEIFDMDLNNVYFAVANGAVTVNSTTVAKAA